MFIRNLSILQSIIFVLSIYYVYICVYLYIYFEHAIYVNTCMFELIQLPYIGKFLRQHIFVVFADLLATLKF